ncbi:MAG: methyltransferase [Pseudoflavonifractor sp.]|nr:methyltransferase [Alloprevotella sp.]MCM1116593.1 methyltransferase [Pseudoflavonifractor sp.]
MASDIPMGIFRFKQFELSNSLSAQRIGTDGVITGAAAPIIPGEESIIWDAGAGTGLIALMIAQRAPIAHIFAVELDPEAALECRANVVASPWASRIEVVEGDFVKIAPSLPAPSLIVSNPPFFTTDTKAPDPRRALARHGNGSLSPSTLIALASILLAPFGKLCFIAPSDCENEIILQAVMSRMEPVSIIDIASREGQSPIRQLWTLMRRGETPAGPVVHTLLEIHKADASHQYTPQFIDLTHEFYINLP